jgi:hypothetical protein
MLQEQPVRSNQGLSEDEFAIEIDFPAESPNASGIFHCMGGLIDAFGSLDGDLAAMLGRVTRTQLVLERVEAGSLKSVLRNVLELLDDEALEQGDWKKLLGRLVLRGKQYALQGLQQQELITPQVVTHFQSDLRQLAAGAAVRPHARLIPVPFGLLLEDIEAVNTALKPLTERDSARLLIQDQTIPLKRNPHFSARRSKKMLIQRQDSRTEEMVLQVKRPDYLGGRTWDFVLDGRTQRLKILDDQWLHNFSQGEVIVRPGDSLRVLAGIDISYGAEDEVISKETHILSVVEVIR